ncbi:MULTISPECIES: DUF4118 domain-containing protein [Microvirga]|uniref:DUF4118 domain-containing protein n=1 Tax=Microvirga TaxID=186650 RepID=UPI00191DC20A|nr:MULTISPECIES: DUF4118 domain-containing protein [Microvirga]MBM6584259.1 DUF4118 domain-containing protein [Microvirga arvi]
MVGSDSPNRDVARFPLVGTDKSELTGLEAVLRRLAISISSQEVMEIIAQAARALLHADGVTFVLRDGDRCYYAEEDAISPLWKGKRFPMEACISGWCMINGQGVIIPDIYADARIPHDAYRPTFVRSLAMVPIGQDNPIAAVGAYWSRLREIPPPELDLLQALGNAAALALSHVELRRAREHERELHNAEGSVGQPSERCPTPPASGPPHQGLTTSAGWQPAGGQVSASSVSTVSGSRVAPPANAESWLSFDIQPHSPAAYAAAITCVLLATLTRLSFGWWSTAELAPFTTYFPAVLATTLIAGVPSGVLCLVLGGAVSWWAFMPPEFSFAVGSPAHIVNFSLYVISSIMILWVAERYRRAHRSLRQEQGWRTLLHEELQNRLKNALAVAQAVVSHTLETSPQKARKINRRLAALMATTSSAGVPRQQEVDLKSLVAAELEPYGTARIEIKGPHVGLEPKLGQALALALHELATNAAKFGALSVPEGNLAVIWSISAGQVHLTWAEHGGPHVVIPKTRGFGTSFLERILSDVDATIVMSFEPEGLVCGVRFVAGPAGR